jgi:heat shock protein HslJ
VAASLAGTAWRVVSVAGAAPVAGREPTITFEPERVSGTTGCNQYFGGYTLVGGAIAFSAVGMTRMACDDAVGQIEGAFTGALTAATSATFDAEGRLHLAGPGGEIVLGPGPATGGS